MRDTVLVGAMVGAFAALVTVHVLIVVGLLRKRPRVPALIALVAAPLAPALALRERMNVRAVAWVVFAVAYGIARAAAAR